MYANSQVEAKAKQWAEMIRETMSRRGVDLEVRTTVMGQVQLYLRDVSGPFCQVLSIKDEDKHYGKNINVVFYGPYDSKLRQRNLGESLKTFSLDKIVEILVDRVDTLVEERSRKNRREEAEKEAKGSLQALKEKFPQYRNHLSGSHTTLVTFQVTMTFGAMEKFLANLPEDLLD